MQLTPEVQKLFLSIIKEKAGTDKSYLIANEELSTLLNLFFDALGSYKNIILNQKFIDFFLFPLKFSEKIKENSFKIINECPEKLNKSEINELIKKLILNYSKSINEFFEQQKVNLDEIINLPETLFKPVLEKLILYFTAPVNGTITYIDNVTNSHSEIIIHIQKTETPEIYIIDLQKLIESYIPNQISPIVYDEFIRFGRKSGELIHSINKNFSHFIAGFEQKVYTDIDRTKCYELAETLLLEFIESNANNQKHNLNTFKITNELSEERFNNIINKIKNDINLIDLNLLAERLSNKISSEEKFKNILKGIPQKWFQVQQLIVNTSLFEHSVARTGAEIDTLFKNNEKACIDFFDSKIIGILKELRGTLATYQEGLNTGKNPELIFNQSISNDQSGLISNLYKSFKNNIENLISQHSTDFEIIKNNIIPNLDDVILDKTKIETGRVLKLFFNDLFWNDLQSIYVSFEELSRGLFNNYLSINKLLGLMIGKLDTKSVNSEQNTLDFIKAQIIRVDSLILESENVRNTIAARLQPIQKSILAELTIEKIISNSENFPIYQAQKRTKKGYLQVMAWYKKIKQKINTQIDKLWYRKSEASLISRNLINSKDTNEPGIEDLHRLFEKITLKSEDINKIPVYYHELFLSKQLYDKEIWKGREKELAKAAKAIEMYKSGYHGAILIYGEANSGKSFISRMIAESYNEKKLLYTIHPPLVGSVSAVDFLNVLINITGGAGITSKEILSLVPEKSVFIFEDIELWWEKSEKGLVVINLIMEMIESLSNKFLFILNLNTHSYEIINKISPISNYFLSTIDCEPVSAEVLKNIVMKRNEMCGLKLINNQTKKGFTNIQLARLFAGYFTYTDGSIGLTMRQWLMNINQVNEQTITINYPKHADWDTCESLDTCHLLVIMQFILHKRLTITKLERILINNQIELQKELNFLERAGVIINETPETYILQPDLYNGFKNVLIEKGLL